MADSVFNATRTQSKVYETEHHVHNYERWFGISADQSGDDWALEAGLLPFTADSGDADFGTAVKVIGPADTPVNLIAVKFDCHRLFITDLQHSTVYFIRVIIGRDGETSANTAESAGNYTDTPVITTDPNLNRFGGVPVDLIMKRESVTERVWVKVKNATDGSTVTFYVGLHEYME